MKKFYLFITASFFLFLTFSCEKKETEKTSGNITFSFSESGMVKSAGNVTTGITNLIISIQKENGENVFELKKLPLLQFGKKYVTQPFALSPGQYNLTSFFVVNDGDSVLYLTPRENTPLASLVNDPLPIHFQVSKDGATNIDVEVVSSSKGLPEEFGYVSFRFEPTFNFLISVFVYDSINKFTLTNADLSVYYNSTLIHQAQLHSVINKITLPERYDTYKLEVSKQGYGTFTQAFTQEDLKMYFKSTDKGPLIVRLEKAPVLNGLVAWYKFNGDVKDYSGNNNNGIYYGRGVYVQGRKGDTNGAIDLDGLNDFIFVNNSPSLNPTTEITISAWVSLREFYGTGYDPIVDKPFTSHVHPYYQYRLGVAANYPGIRPYSFGFNVSIDHQNTGTYSESYSWSPEQWYFALGTFDGKYLKFYLNGTHTHSEEMNGPISIYNSNLCIGRSGNLNLTGNVFTPVTVDEVRIYNRALTEHEILELYHD